MHDVCNVCQENEIQLLKLPTYLHATYKQNRAASHIEYSAKQVLSNLVYTNLRGPAEMYDKVTQYTLAALGIPCKKLG